MVRLLFIALLFAAIFWVLRDFDRNMDEEPPQDMVCDALTGVYFPKSEAVNITRHGETLYFMNIENRDRYLTNNR